MKTDISDIVGRKVIVCGGREFSEQTQFNAAMDRMHYELGGITMVIEGGNRRRDPDDPTKLLPTADLFAKLWAQGKGIHVATVEALWSVNGRAAGPIRNAAMLTLQPMAVIAFPGGAGTASMIKMAAAAGIQIHQPLNREGQDMRMERLIEGGEEARLEFGEEEGDGLDE